MTISTSTRTAGPFTGTGALVPYPFAFKVFQASDLLVVRQDLSGIQTTLALSVDYTVVLNADQNAAPGGVLTLLTALPAGYMLQFTSNISTTQNASLTNAGGFFPRTIEDALDRLTIIMQQLGIIGTAQAVRVPELGGIPALPAVAARAGNLLSFDSLGQPVAVAPASGSAAALATDLTNSLLAAKGAGQVAYGDSVAYGAATVGAALRQRAPVISSIAALRALLKTGTPSAFVTGYYAANDGGGGLYYYDSTDTVTVDNGGTVIVASDGGRWKLVIAGSGASLSARQFGAKGDDATNDTTALTAWVAACATAAVRGYLPGGTFRATTSLTIASGVSLFGLGSSLSVLRFGGCDGLTTATGSGGFNQIADMQIRSSNATFTVDDLKANKGVNCAGTAGAHVNNIALRGVYLRGWNICVDWQYAWTSVLDNVDTINCNYGLRLFGQAVNNAVGNSRLLANTGTASIITTINGPDRGEGLMVGNSLLASGTYGFQSDGFLAVHFANVITDLINDTGIKCTGSVAALSYKGGWVYAGNRGFSFDDLGSVTDLGNTIDTYITTTLANSIGIYWGTNNKGLSLAGGEVTIPNVVNPYALFLNGSKVALGPVLISDNSSAGHALFVNTAQVSGISNLQGDVTVTYNTTPVIPVASATAMTLPKTNDSNSFAVTGTTAVTSVAAANWAGQVVKINFTGILTFTNGSNLKLASNFVTAAGSSIVLWCDGTNFYEIGRKA